MAMLSAVSGLKVAAPAKAAVAGKRQPAAVRATVRAGAEPVGRREAFTLLSSAVALTAATREARAAGGKGGTKAPLNILKPDQKMGQSQFGFKPFVSPDGDFSMLVPQQYFSDPEQEYEGQVARFIDNYDNVSNVVVVKKPGKSSVTDYGSVDDWVASQVNPLLGFQAYKSLESEGFKDRGFSNNVTQGTFQDTRAFTLETKTRKDAKGRTYYQALVLTQASDGNEGGRYQYWTGACSGGNLYMTRAQGGLKRWFQDQGDRQKGTWDSFELV